MLVTFDTTFFVSHYFSEGLKFLEKTREILRRSRLQVIAVPSIVLAEFYSQAALVCLLQVAEFGDKNYMLVSCR